MKLKSILLPLGLAVGFASSAFAYQATGPITELTDSKIVIDKGKDGKWEFARTPTTKVTGELKVGSKVTIEYSMSASSVEVRPEKAPKADKPATPAEPKKKAP